MRCDKDRYGKIIPIVVLMIALLVIVVGCEEKPKEKSANDKLTRPEVREKTDDTNRYEDKKRGNSVGNIANSGFVAQKDGWIYFCNPNDTSLNKMKSDGTNETRIFEGNFYEINVMGDWIYCSDEVGYKYYKIRNDGKEKYKLSDDECFDVNIVENWIYYISLDGRIYKMDLEGMNRTKLNNDESCRLNVEDGWIYFCKVLPQTKTEISDAAWLPYGKIYKMKTDGNEEMLVCDNNSSFINVNNGWIYYGNVEDDLHLYRIKFDGTGKMKLNNDSCCDINITGRYVYYSNISSLGELYRSNLDGSGRTPIGGFESKCWDVNVTDNYLFFNYITNNPGVDGFYRTRLDGTEKTRVQ